MSPSTTLGSVTPPINRPSGSSFLQISQFSQKLPPNQPLNCNQPSLSPNRPPNYDELPGYERQDLENGLREPVVIGNQPRIRPPMVGARHITMANTGRSCSRKFTLCSLSGYNICNCSCSYSGFDCHPCGCCILAFLVVLATLGIVYLVINFSRGS
jgi:hypothetical protein